MNSLTSALTTVPTLLNICAVMWLLWFANRPCEQHAERDATRRLWEKERTARARPDRD